MIPTLSGIHHVKLPVADLPRSIDWYAAMLGYAVRTEFVEDGVLMGVVLDHPAGGPLVGLRLDPERASWAGFDHFAIAVPGRAGLEELAESLIDAGAEHDGIHPASAGWVLPGLHDPDGHEIRFYTDDVGR